jgi:hypothetical protein
MPLRGEDILAGPIVRRVATDQVSVWIAFRVSVSAVRLVIYDHHSDEGIAHGEVTVAPVQIGKGLYVALPTVVFQAGTHLDPGTIYGYDLYFDGDAHQNLGGLGLLSDTTIGGHRHLALGYDEGKLPTFVTPAGDAASLTLAHGSCRRPCAQGLDALVALDQAIEGSRETPERPQFLFLTGDQIYADDLSDEMLAWANDAAVELVGRNAAGLPIEQLRVELPADVPARTVRFVADRFHFPPGRRARLCGRAAGLTSDDNQNHALSFGEIAAHYLMSWSNILWPKFEDPAPTNKSTWVELYKRRGNDVAAYLAAWCKTNQLARDVVAAKVDIPSTAHFQDRLERVDSWLLLPPENRVIDQFAHPPPNAPIDEWYGESPDWKKVWTTAGKNAPRPVDDVTIGVRSLVDVPDELRPFVTPNKFPEPEGDLADLARLLTPAWFAGRRHFGVDHDYKPGDSTAPPAKVTDSNGTDLSGEALFQELKKLQLYGDDVLLRLDRLRCFYEGLPYARRALANVSTLMMFDDHEVTDDFAVTKRWRSDLSDRALGRDVMTNALAAYLVFQDWGNDPKRYTDDTHNREAFETVQRMFVEDGQAREHGPEDFEREDLENLFGFAQGTEPSFDDQVTWNFSITDPDVAPYEILTLDNRTRRGYDTDVSEPSDLSLEAIATQVRATGPAGSTVTIVIAPLPVVGYPPMEEIAQPIASLLDSVKDERRLDTGDAFPNAEFDYKFGKLIADPEAWAFSTKAQEALFERLSSRSAVVLLSGDIHFSLTGKVTYWKHDPGSPGNPSHLVPVSRFVQLISSALKNEPGGMKQALVQLGIAEQLGAIIGGPYDRLGWREGGVNGPDFATPQTPHQLAVKMRKNPAVIPVRMLDAATKDRLRSRTLTRPPEWAWRFEVVKDLRFDDERYGTFTGATPEWTLPTEQELAANPKAAFQKIANHHAWHARYGLPRRSFFYSNIGLVRFEGETEDSSSPLVVVHSLYAWDRAVTGPRGTIAYDKPWPLGREEARPFTEYRVPLSFANEIAPDQPDPSEPQPG